MSCAERNRSRPREEINVPIVFALAATKKKVKKKITPNCWRLNTEIRLPICFAVAANKQGNKWDFKWGFKTNCPKFTTDKENIPGLVFFLLRVLD